MNLRRVLLEPGALAVAFVFFGLSREARAETYVVGPGQPYADLAEIEDMLAPGDVVEVMGDATYPGNVHIRPESSGTAQNKVTLRGIPVNGRRPVLSGGDEFTIVLNASHLVFEGFEVTGGGHYCVVHKADDVTIRDVVVHDCPQHGILGTDFDSGSLTIEHSEVYGCGNGLSNHQLYIATDESQYPGSVFRLQHSYIHDNRGGNLVKSRSERNEIYYNWLETGEDGYHAMDLIGPDGQDEGLAREDSDVVGNVVIQHGDWQIARIGGDGTGQTGGRYRFAYNTILVPAGGEPLFRLQDAVGSIEIENNVVLFTGSGATLVDTDGAAFTGGRAVGGGNNWISNGVTLPPELDGSMRGDDAGFVDLAGFNYVPAMGSPLIDAAGDAAAPNGAEVPNPLREPSLLPPTRQIEAPGATAQRGLGGAVLDVGAYEFGAIIDPGMTTSSTTDATSTGSTAPPSTGATNGAGNGAGNGTGPGAGNGAGNGAGSGAGAGGDDGLGGGFGAEDGGLNGTCACRTATPSSPGDGAHAAWIAVAFATIAAARRSSRRR